MIQCFLYQGNDKYKILDNKDFKSDLLRNYDNAIKYLQANLHTEFIIGKEREEKLEIPLVALREALINALVHRDYFATPSIYVNIFQDRVEIVNAGGLPKRISVNDLYLSSRPRNHLLFEIFQRLGLVERAGSGLMRINDSLKNEGINPAKIDATEMTFRIGFERNLKYQSDTINDTIKSKTVLILDYIKKNSACSAVHISSAMKIPIATVKRHLKKLNHKIEYKGSKKSGGYYTK